MPINLERIEASQVIAALNFKRNQESEAICEFIAMVQHHGRIVEAADKSDMRFILPLPNVPCTQIWLVLQNTGKVVWLLAQEEGDSNVRATDQKA